MNDSDEEKAAFKQLRERAETLATPSSVDAGALSPDAVEKLIYELDVHRIELEMQNEELRRSQEDLIESDSRLSDLFHLAPVSYLNLDQHGLISSLNFSAASLLGNEPTRLIGKPFQLFVAVDDRNRFIRHLRDCASAEGICSVEVRLAVKGRADLFVRLDSIPVRNTKSNTLVYRTVLIDIEKYKQVEQSLQKANSLLELQLAKKSETLSQRMSQLQFETTHREAAEQIVDLLFDRSSSAMIMLNRDGEILRVSVGAERLFGYSQNQLLKQSLAKLLPGTILDEVFAHLDDPEARSAGSIPRSRSCVGCCSDGRNLPLELQVTRLHHGGSFRFLATMVRRPPSAEGASAHMNKGVPLSVIRSHLSKVSDQQLKYLGTVFHEEIERRLAAAGDQANTSQLQELSTTILGYLELSQEVIQLRMTEALDSTADLGGLVLDQIEFEDTMVNLCGQISAIDGKRIPLMDDGEPKPLGPHKRTALFRAVREVIVFAFGHTEAAKVKVALTRVRERVRVRVSTEGKELNLMTRESVGILFAKEQVEQLGGRFDWQFSRDTGLVVTIEVPLDLEVPRGG